jgi:hypothetical protein
MAVTRWKELKDRQTLAWWDRYFRFINDKCPWLNGNNDRGWKAGWDFVMNPRNMAEIIEGKYIERRK